MTETSASVAAFMVTVSATLLAVFGVDYYSLLGGLFGAMLALGGSVRMSRAGAIAFVLLSTFAGAIAGSVAAAYFERPPRVAVIGLCIVGGIISQAVASGLMAAAPGLVKSVLEALGKRVTGGKP